MVTLDMRSIEPVGTVRIQLMGVGIFRARVWLATRLIWLAAIFCPMNIEINS